MPCHAGLTRNQTIDDFLAGVDGRHDALHVGVVDVAIADVDYCTFDVDGSWGNRMHRWCSRVGWLAQICLERTSNPRVAAQMLRPLMFRCFAFPAKSPPSRGSWMWSRPETRRAG